MKHPSRFLDAMDAAGREPGSPLARITHQAQLLQRLQSLLHAQLPETAHRHVAVAGLDRGTLRVVCRSAAWASRIRYAQRQITAAISDRLDMQLTRIDVSVRPAALDRPVDRPRPLRGLSSRAAAHLLEMADDEGETALGEALRNLARHTR